MTSKPRGRGKRKAKAYPVNTPVDLARLVAVGLARPARRASRRSIERRLGSLKLYIEHRMAPDAKGKRMEAPDGGVGHAGVPVPAELEDHLVALLATVERCYELLADDDLEGATQKLRDIDELAREIRDAALAHKMEADRRKGPETRRGTRKCPGIYSWLLEQLSVDPKAKNKQLAESFPADGMHLHRDHRERKLSDGTVQVVERAFCEDGAGWLSRHGFNRYVTMARKKPDNAP